MGLNEIKVILETLQRACTDAEKDGKRDIGSVLLIPEFINSLRQLWAHIPLKTKRSIGRRPNQGLRSSRKRLKAPNKSKITLPHALTAKLHFWESDPLLFFTEDSGISLDLGTHPLVGSYNYVSRLERRTETDTIRLRLCKVIYHRLKERLCLNYLRTDNIQRVAQIINQSGMTEDEPDLIKQRVSRWTDEGKRIDTLCRDIHRARSLDDSHLGTLFCLPQDIPDELIRTLPLTGPDREEEIRLLHERGISQIDGKENLNNLAKSIFSRLWERIESAVSRLHISEPGSNWELQHTQSFSIQGTGISSQGSEDGADTATTSSSSGRISSGSRSAAVVSPLPSPPGPETTTENGRTTYQDSTPLSLQVNTVSVQPEFCLQGPEAMGGVDNTSSLFENVEPVRTVPELQSSYPMTGANSKFNLFENVEPLQTAHGLQRSYPMTGVNSRFNLFENVEPLQMVHGLQSSYPMTGANSTSNLFEINQLPQAPHALQGSFKLYERVQPLPQPFSGFSDDGHIVAEDSQSNWPRSTSCQQFSLPVSVP